MTVSQQSVAVHEEICSCIRGTTDLAVVCHCSRFYSLALKPNFFFFFGGGVKNKDRFADFEQVGVIVKSLGNVLWLSNFIFVLSHNSLGQ